MCKLKLLVSILIILCAQYAYAQNWTLQYKDSTRVFWDIHFADTLNGWAVGDSGVIISTSDGGLNWSVQESNTKKMLNGITSLNTNKALVVGDSGLILTTLDGGNTWVRKESGTTYSLQKLSFIDLFMGWIIGSKFPSAPTYHTTSILLHTFDGGNKWSKIGDTIDGGFVDIQFINEKKGWIAGTDEFFDNFTAPWIFNTTAGGNTWNQQNLPFNVGPLRSIYFVDSNYGWSVGLGMSLNNLAYKTTNGGIDWLGVGWIEGDTLTFPFAFSDIYFNNKSEGWVAGGKGIYHTTNGGTSWLLQVASGLRGGGAIHSPEIGFAWSVYSTEIWRYKEQVVSIDIVLEIPTDFELNQNFPNPFNSSTIITFTLPVRSSTKLEIFDVLGSSMKVLVNSELGEGKHKYNFDGKGLASGIYYYTLSAGTYKKTRKMIYLK